MDRSYHGLINFMKQRLDFDDNRCFDPNDRPNIAYLESQVGRPISVAERDWTWKQATDQMFGRSAVRVGYGGLGYSP